MVHVGYIYIVCIYPVQSVRMCVCICLCIRVYINNMLPFDALTKRFCAIGDTRYMRNKIDHVSMRCKY